MGPMFSTRLLMKVLQIHIGRQNAQFQVCLFCFGLVFTNDTMESVGENIFLEMWRKK